VGNHTAGHAINREVTAEFGNLGWIALASDRHAVRALEALDRAMERAKASPGFSPDAEFEATHPRKPDIVHDEINDWRDPHPASPLGLLMVAAFAPHGLLDLNRYWPMVRGTRPGDPEAEEEGACDAWWKEVNEPFRQRYGLY